MAIKKVWKAVQWVYYPVTEFYERMGVSSDRLLSTLCFISAISLMIAIGLSYFVDILTAFGNAGAFLAYLVGGLVVYNNILSERDKMITVLANENEPDDAIQKGY